MESWEPEESFDKADFPVRKKKAQPPPSGDGKPASQNPPKQAGQPQRPSQQPAPPPSADSGDRVRIGQWSPDLEFDQADFKGVPKAETLETGDDKRSSDAIQDIARRARRPQPAGDEPKRARSWQPPRVDRGDEASPDRPLFPRVSSADAEHVVRRKQPDPSAAVPANSASRSAARSGARNSRSGPGFTERILQELVILQRENARHILRNWSWEKPKMAPEGLAHIAAHDRIFIVLSGLGPKVLEILYESMTPAERRQMQEILTEPRRRNPAANEIITVRNAFMQRIRGDA